jgi:type IV secretory pathway TrbF-like protein
VTVKDSAQVWSVLKTARKRGESADYKSVVVKKDSTPLERVVFRQKWQERIRRKGTENQVNHFQAVKTIPAAHEQSEEMEDK